MHIFCTILRFFGFSPLQALLGSDSGRTDFSRIFVFEPPDFFADCFASFEPPDFFADCFASFLWGGGGGSAQKNPPRKSPAKSSKTYATKIPDNFLQRGRAKHFPGQLNLWCWHRLEDRFFFFQFLSALLIHMIFLEKEVTFQGEIISPPPLTPFLARRHFSGEGGGRVYFEAPRGRNFIPPPPLLYTPHPKRVFSPGVLRSKDFFAPIFVVFRDFCKSYFWHPYFYRVFGYFR